MRVTLSCLSVCLQCVCLRVCMFVIVGQTAGLIRTNFDTWIRLDPGIVLGKSWSSSERRRREREGQKRSKCRIGVATEVEVKVKVPQAVPRATEMGRMPQAGTDAENRGAVGADRFVPTARENGVVPFKGQELQLVINNILARHHCWLDVILINRSIEAVYLV